METRVHLHLQGIRGGEEATKMTGAGTEAGTIDEPEEAVGKSTVEEVTKGDAAGLPHLAIEMTTLREIEKEVSSFFPVRKLAHMREAETIDCCAGPRTSSRRSPSPHASSSRRRSPSPSRRRDSRSPSPPRRRDDPDRRRDERERSSPPPPRRDDGRDRERSKSLVTADDAADVDEQDIAALMGFGGFGTTQVSFRKLSNLRETS